MKQEQRQYQLICKYHNFYVKYFSYLSKINIRHLLDF